MHQDDINFARVEIEKHREKTPYGPGLAMPWCFVEDALKEIDQWKELCFLMMMIGDRQTADCYNQHVDADGNLRKKPLEEE